MVQSEAILTNLAGDLVRVAPYQWQHWASLAQNGNLISSMPMTGSPRKLQPQAHILYWSVKADITCVPALEPADELHLSTCPILIRHLCGASLQTTRDNCSQEREEDMQGLPPNSLSQRPAVPDLLPHMADLQGFENLRTK